MKQLSILLALCFAVFTMSCDNSNDGEIKTTISGNQIYTVTSTNGSTLTFPACNIKYEIDYIAGKVDITLNNVKFSPRMPEITMKINDIHFTNSQNGIKINTTNLTPEVAGNLMPEYTISSLSGRIATSNFTGASKSKISLTLENGTTITFFPSPIVFEYDSNTMVNAHSSDLQDHYSTDKVCYVLEFSSTAETANLLIYNAKFAEKMPAMNMAFKNIPFTASKTGFTMSIESLTPSIIGKTGSEYTDPTYNISNLNIKVDGNRLSTDFTCTITDKDNSAIGGYLVLAYANLFPSEAITNKN